MKTNAETAPRIQGLEIKKLREDLGLTQDAFAKRLGVSRFSVIAWEAGGRSPLPLIQQAIRSLQIR